MYELQINIEELVQHTMQVGAAIDQMPYALSRALNDSLVEARDYIIEHTWPEHVKVRNPNFIRRLLHIEFSDKHHLEGAIVEDKTAVRGNAHLALHDKGGMKIARGDFAIPTQNVTLTSFGPRADQKPTALKNAVKLGHVLYQRRKKGYHHTALVPMYVLPHTVNQPADVPFTEDFQEQIKGQIRHRFLVRMMEAMATRR